MLHFYETEYENYEACGLDGTGDGDSVYPRVSRTDKYSPEAYLMLTECCDTATDGRGDGFWYYDAIQNHSFGTIEDFFYYDILVVRLDLPSPTA